MKISEIIASLQATLNEHGDIEAILSSDTEGNEFRSADVGGREFAYKDAYEWFTVHEDDLEEYEDHGLVSVVVFW